MDGSGRKSRRFRMVGVLLVCMAALQSSCGTILYPERRGQKSGQLDVAVILLDGACLLVFVIPGIIAFAVDFATGAIYLPPGKSDDKSSEKHYHEVRVTPAELTPQRLEAIVREHTGKTVDLRDGAYRAMRIESIEQFTPQTVASLEASPTPGPGFDELLNESVKQSTGLVEQNSR
jgi:hypothetical protein